MSEAPKREERPRQAARRINKITDAPKNTTRDQRRLYLLLAMGAS